MLELISRNVQHLYYNAKIRMGEVRHVRFISHSFLEYQTTTFWGGVSGKMAENIVTQNHLLMIFPHVHSVVSHASAYEPTNGFI